MLWAIIKKEFLGMVLRSQFIFASAIILVLVVLGVGMLLDEYAEDVQDHGTYLVVRCPVHDGVSLTVGPATHPDGDGKMSTRRSSGRPSSCSGAR